MLVTTRRGDKVCLVRGRNLRQPNNELNVQFEDFGDENITDEPSSNEGFYDVTPENDLKELLS
jgi:hypothetical protein